MPIIRFSRRAVSLIEVAIGVLVFSVLSLAVIESLSGMTSMATTRQADANLSIEAESILQQIHLDLVQSGWHFPSFISDSYVVEATVADMLADRQMVYFPYVLQQSPEPAGTTLGDELRQALPDAGVFDYTATDQTEVVDNLKPYASGFSLSFANRQPSMVDLYAAAPPPAGLPGDAADARRVFHRAAGAPAADDDPSTLIDYGAYYQSFYARSQEILFVRIANSVWTADPYEQEAVYLHFDDHPTNPAGHPWRPHNEREIATRIETLMSPPTSLPYGAASNQLLETEFHHKELGILRMTEFWPRFARDPITGESLPPGASSWSDVPAAPIADADGDGRPELIPWKRAGAAVPAKLQQIDVLDSPGAWIERLPGNLFAVQPRWETMVPEDNLRTVNFSFGSTGRRLRNDYLRIYGYAVIPSPLDSGTGRLVRCYSIDTTLPVDPGNPSGPKIYSQVPSLGSEVGDCIALESGAFVGGSAVQPARATYARYFVIDRVLSDNVARIVFDTYRTADDPSAQPLGMNEVRVRLYLARRTGSALDTQVHHFSETSVMMRSATNTEATIRTEQILGARAVGLPR